MTIELLESNMHKLFSGKVLENNTIPISKKYQKGLDKSMDTSDFNFIFLGQSVLRYKVPLDVYQIINHIYESNFQNLHPANRQLVGKIQNEHSLFYNGEDQSKMVRHNLLPTNSITLV
jgi:hypothetical protein